MARSITVNDSQPMKSQQVTRPGYAGAQTGDATVPLSIQRPLQSAVKPTTESKKEHEGPGYVRTPDAVAGPPMRPQPVNQAAQSVDAKRLESDLPEDADFDGAGDNVRTIDRDTINQNQSELYGNT